MISRRMFMTGTTAAAIAAAAIPAWEPALASIPTIHANGLHDDTAGLQAAIDGKPFAIPLGLRMTKAEGCPMVIDGASFRISRTLWIPPHGSMAGFTRCDFVTSEQFSGDHMVAFA